MTFHPVARPARSIIAFGVILTALVSPAKADFPEEPGPSWVSRYNGSAGSQDGAHSIVMSADGSRVFVTGLSASPANNTDFATIGYSTAEGAQLWVARYNGIGNGADESISIGITPDGTKVFVAGRSAGLNNHADYATVAYSPVQFLHLGTLLGEFREVDQANRNLGPR